MLDTYRKILDLLDWRERRRFFLLVGMSIILGVVEAAGVLSVFPFIAIAADPSIVDRVAILAWLRDGLGLVSDDAFVAVLGAISFVVLLSGIGFRALSLHASTRFARERASSLGTRLLAGFMAQPYVWFLGRHSAELERNVLDEVNEVVRGSIMHGMMLPAHVAVVLALVGVLVAVEPGAALVAGGLLALSYAVIFVTVRGRLARLGRRRLGTNQARYKTAHEALSGIKDIKFLHVEQRYLARFADSASRHARTRAEIELISQLPRMALEAVIFGAMILFILWLLHDRGGLAEALPVLGIYAVASARLIPVVQRLYASVAAIRADRPALRNLHHNLTCGLPAPADWAATADPTPAPVLHLHRAVEMEDVVYTFPLGQRRALTGLSMVIPARTTVGIIGATGAGKSTAIDILLGLLQPQSGRLLIDGVPLEPANLRAWQRSVGYVPQSIFLLDDTLAANIALGDPTGRIDRAAVERAARLAELHDFVTTTSHGYDTLVGERGTRLSGGQRQRVAIARALYRDPDVLVFDEATSALDNLTEQAVMQAVRGLGGDRTIVLVAHRLSTVRVCDVIYLLDNGRVAASGSYEDLVRRSAHFRAMHEAHAAGVN